MGIFEKLSSIKISISLGDIFVIAGIVTLILIFIKFIFKNIKKKFTPKKVTISLMNIVNMEIESNRTTSILAHKAWVELSTRKAGILFDEKNDVIVDIYDSWYELFKQLREILKSVEPSKNSDVNKLTSIIIEVLNDGLRMHLTKWQAKFRSWYGSQLDDIKNVEPQILQKKYKYYDDLIDDLRKTNEILIALTRELDKVRKGGE